LGDKRDEEQEDVAYAERGADGILRCGECNHDLENLAGALYDWFKERGPYLQRARQTGDYSGAPKFGEGMGITVRSGKLCCPGCGRMLSFEGV
jgi:hypothetical protein